MQDGHHRQPECAAAEHGADVGGVGAADALQAFDDAGQRFGQRGLLRADTGGHVEAQRLGDGEHVLHGTVGGEPEPVVVAQ